MIKVKLNELAKKLGKTIMDMADETGLNRNSLSALVNNKVDGIKFPTLEKICATYNLKIEDLLELKLPEKINKVRNIYRQEGEMVPFFCFLPAVNATVYAYNLDNKRYKVGDLDFYSQDKYVFAYWDSDSLHNLANAIYDYYGPSPTRFDNIYLNFSKYAHEIEDIYLNSDSKTVVALDDKDLKVYTESLKTTCSNFWSSCLFIDSFDPGKDQEEIKKIKEKYNFELEEIGVLTTPVQMTFSNEREYRFLKLVELAIQNKIQVDSDKIIDKFVKTEPAVQQYKKQFDYYKSNYYSINHISDDDIVQGIKTYLKDQNRFREELDKFENYPKNQETKINKILAKHRLSTNPLWFFNKLTYWREYRKKINLMSIHILDMILDSVENKTGIQKKILHYAIPDEVNNILEGSIDKDNLEKRKAQHMLVSFRDDGYRMIIGKEADSIKNGLEKIRSSKSQETIISGQVASQGYAKGIARIILGIEDFSKFKEGEILISGMTRPEFVPLMKKAAAIVTNEGGITCHAAIVSRELGKPCIIGTKNATTLIKDGDLIEVRAHHGTVRILK